METYSRAVQGGTEETKAEPESRRLELKGWRTRVMPLDRRAMVELEDRRTKIELGVWKTNAEPQRGRTTTELEG